MAGTREKSSATVSRVFGRQVKEAREQLRLSQAELAQRLEEQHGVTMHQVTIARLETGERRVTVDDALALAAALGVNPLYLFSGDFTNEPVPVTPRLGEVAPSQIRFWFEGTLPLPNTDERSFFELVPGEELLARQKRGIQHLRESVRHFVQAAVANDRTEMGYALRLIGKELDRQQEGLELEERRSRKEDDDVES